jgi:hypothetical protein
MRRKTQVTADEGLRKLAAMLTQHVSVALVDDFVGFLDAGEPDVGLEFLCDALFDQEIPLSRAEVDLIRAEGLQMGVTRASVLRISELLSVDGDQQPA